LFMTHSESAPAPCTRRDFLARSASIGAAALPTIVSARALGLEPGTAAASERITLGVIGIGSRCTYVLGSMLTLPDVQCVAIADVQATRRAAGKKLVDEHYGTADTVLYRDFRELLARPDIDAVLIATGDRWHGPAAIMAAEAGKDVYCEKPCGLTIEICRRIAETFQKTQRVFQAGTQRRSVPNFVAAVKLAQAGRLGGLRQLNASVYEPVLGNDWLPAEKTRLWRSATGTCGWVLPPGGPTTTSTWRGSGAGSTTSTRAPGCSTGARTPWTSASGPTTPTARPRSNTGRSKPGSNAAMPTG
jgi:hypothetical protein